MTDSDIFLFLFIHSNNIFFNKNITENTVAKRPEKLRRVVSSGEYSVLDQGSIENIWLPSQVVYHCSC